MAKIYIDPGHNASGADTGAVGFGIKEQDITVRIGVMLRDLLVKNGQSVKMSRESINDTVAQGLNESLSLRAEGANSWGADIFVSIHCNSANSKAYGTETYCISADSDGYRLAKYVQDRLVNETGRADRGVKTANFAVLRSTNMPAILVEIAFIDNYEDNKYMASEAGKKAFATAIYKGICDYYGLDCNISEGDDKDMSKEYEENRAKNAAQDDIINIMGDEIAQNKADIQQIGSEPARYDYVDSNMPEWAIPTITKLINNGYLVGDSDGKLGLSTDQMRVYVVNDRAGLYDK